MPFVIEFNGVPEVQTTETFWLNCLFTILDSPSSSQHRKFRAKLYVDDVEKAIKSAQWTVRDSQPAGTLNIELADLSERSAFTRTAEIRLEVEEYLTGVWTLVKTYCDGSILATSNYSLENNGLIPNDSFSVTVLPLLQQRLDKTPDQIVVLYDPNKTMVTDDELEVVLDIDGEQEGEVVVQPIADMHLGDVLDYIATTLGFAGFKTNINYEPWKLSRVDFPAGVPYWGAIAGIIGNHEPKLSIDADNNLVIRDGTLTDYVAARQMTLANFRALNLNKTIERYKGCLVTQQLRVGLDWDYWTLRQRVEHQWWGGIGGAYPLTVFTTWFQDFYRNSFPDTPVRSQIFSTKEIQYTDAFTIASARQENFSYRFGPLIGVRPTRTNSYEWGWANVPQSWIDYHFFIPSPHVDFAPAGFETGAQNSYTSASDVTFSEALVLTGSSQILYSYKPLPGEAVYANQTDTESRALIMRDNDNPQLDDPFDQPHTRAQESGNLATGQGSYWGTTNYNTESQTTENRRVDIRTRGLTPLNSSAGLNHTNYRDRRIGDIGDQSDIQTETKTLKITEGADPTATLWRQVNGGEAPLVVLQPLCIRLNQRQDLPGGIEAPLPTYDQTIEMGGVIDAKVDGRTSTSLGIFEIIGYTDTFDREGFSTEIAARQIA